MMVTAELLRALSTIVTERALAGTAAEFDLGEAVGWVKDLTSRRNDVSIALGRLCHDRQTPVIRVRLGFYRAIVDGEDVAALKRRQPTYTRTRQGRTTPARPHGTVFELMAELAGDQLLVRDDLGNLYVAKPLPLP